MFPLQNCNYTNFNIQLRNSGINNDGISGLYNLRAEDLPKNLRSVRDCQTWNRRLDHEIHNPFRDHNTDQGGGMLPAWDVEGVASGILLIFIREGYSFPQSVAPLLLIKI